MEAKGLETAIVSVEHFSTAVLPVFYQGKRLRVTEAATVAWLGLDWR